MVVISGAVGRESRIMPQRFASSSAVIMQEVRRPARTRPVPRGGAVLLGILAAALGFGPEFACAHAILVAGRRAMNSTVGQGELEIRLDFNSRIDRQRSRVTLRLPDGTETAVALAPNAPPSVLAGRAQAT